MIYKLKHTKNVPKPKNNAS